MKQGRLYPTGYMFIVTAVLSTVLIGLTEVTRERVEANAETAFQQAVLRVLPGLYEERMSGLQVYRRFTEKVTPPSEESGGAWVHIENGRVLAYAVPVGGQGFWAPIKGMIGVAADRETVTGIAFYEQNETPGLGAEIETPAWRGQFRGKRLADDPALVMRRPGEPLGEHDVHAVTGATQTSVRLAGLINEGIAAWRRELDR